MEIVNCPRCGLRNAGEDAACERCGADLWTWQPEPSAAAADLSLTAEVTEIKTEGGRGGHAKVRYRLERGAEVFAVLTVRVFFDRDDLTLAQLKTAAIAHGFEVCREVARLAPAPAVRPAARAAAQGERGK